LFNPAPQRRLSGLDEQKALSYRNELRSHMRDLQQHQFSHDPRFLDDSRRTQQELNRIDRLLQSR
jgi:hypothetical protein